MYIIGLGVGNYLPMLSYFPRILHPTLILSNICCHPEQQQVYVLLPKSQYVLGSSVGTSPEKTIAVGSELNVGESNFVENASKTRSGTPGTTWGPP